MTCPFPPLSITFVCPRATWLVLLDSWTILISGCHGFPSCKPAPSYFCFCPPRTRDKNWSAKDAAALLVYIKRWSDPVNGLFFLLFLFLFFVFFFKHGAARVREALMLRKYFGLIWGWYLCRKKKAKQNTCSAVAKIMTSYWYTLIFESRTLPWCPPLHIFHTH